MESKLVTGRNDARQSLVTILHGSGWTTLKYISIQNLKYVCLAVWQSIDNVEMYKYAKFYQHIPCGFSSPFCIAVDGQC